MGRVRQTFIKKTAIELVKKHGNELSSDFQKNREFLDKVVKLEGKTLRNRIAGYITRLMKEKKREIG